MKKGPQTSRRERQERIEMIAELLLTGATRVMASTTSGQTESAVKEENKQPLSKEIIVMRTSLTIQTIDSLADFIEWVRPACQASYEEVNSRPRKKDKIRLNVMPETAASIAADEFVQKLPADYTKRTTKPNPLLPSGRKIDLRKTVPAEVVLTTVRRMKTLVVGDEPNKQASGFITRKRTLSTQSGTRPEVQ